ncbi:PAS domain S-box protein [Methylomonas sp. AM2-LC]|uniref:PAS domain S-box protein n=1 Tax=Methylomonas sp. AM2-LC TaxID=3153301 RepID=UPI0032635CDF
MNKSVDNAQSKSLQDEESAVEEDCVLKYKKNEYISDLFSQAPLPYLVLSGEGVILKANHYALSLLQISSEQLSLHNFADFLPAIDRQSFAHYLKTLLLTDKVIDCLVTLKLNASRYSVQIYATRDKLQNVCLLNLVKVTPLIEVKESLYQSKDFLASILNSLSAQIAVLDRHGMIITTNDAWLKLAEHSSLLVSRNTVLGSNYLDECLAVYNRFKCHEALVMYKGILAVLSGQQPLFAMEYFCHWVDDKFWFRIVVSSLKDSELGVVVSHEEITERKSVEEEIKSNEKRMRAIIESSPIPMALHDDQLNMLSINQSFIRLFNYDLSDLPTLEDWWQKAFPDHEYRQSIQASWYAARHNVHQLSDVTQALELVIHCKHNVYKTVLVSFTVIETQESNLYLLVFYDITQRKQIEAKLNSIFHAATDVIISYDISRNIVSANDASVRVFGYPAQELLGCNIGKIIPTLSKNIFDCNSCLSKSEKGIYQAIEIDGVHKQGAKLSLEMSKSAYSIDNECFFTIIIRDISLRKKREKQDLEHLKELAHVTRLGLMGEMASGIAHEVNQPLSAISSYAQASINLIKSNSLDLHNLTDILTKIQQQSVRAGQIIHRMREFVRANPKHISTIDINVLIDEAVSLCTTDLRDNKISVVLNFADHLPMVNVDNIQIEQVIINLIRNSIDVLQLLPANQQRLLSIDTVITDNHEIEVRIKDNGPGIPTDEQLKILSPFYTTKEEGMGMGLSISRSIIESHEGVLRFNSKVGKGSTFYFSLPINRLKKV